MKFVVALLSLVFALATAYVGYMFMTAAMTEKIAAKGFVLQSLPLLGGIALIIFALPLLWQCVALIVVKPRA
jgi:TRAP-type C4-dicarboxylate transport system permease small subunit